MELEEEVDGDTSVDFNLAHNPYCIYDDDFVCPLPPVENWIPLSIEAGEKTYEIPKMLGDMQ